MWIAEGGGGGALAVAGFGFYIACVSLAVAKVNVTAAAASNAQRATLAGRYRHNPPRIRQATKNGPEPP